jgi:hypothetical protein
MGVRIGMHQFEAVRATAVIGQRVDAPLALSLTNLDRSDYWPPRMTGVVALQALLAAGTYTMIVGFSIDPNLRRRAQPPVELSSDLAVPEDQPG